VFGISGSEFLVIVLVAVVVVGPQRLPEYTRKLTQMVRQLRVFLDNARSQIAEEVGPEMADLDLSSLDPRQYDPRKIVRDALGEDIDAIREDLAHPFRSVGSAAKEVSDDAAQVVNDVVKQDRAKSLSKQIEAKRAEQLAEKNSASNADDDAENNTEADTAADAETDTEADIEADIEADAIQAEARADNASTESQDAAEGIEAADLTDAAENTEASVISESPAPPQGVLQKADGAESDVEQPEETESPESGEQPAEPASVEVPASLVEPGVDTSDEYQQDASEATEDSGTRARPLSPRDIVRAANAAARTRAEAAHVAVDF